MAKTIEQVMTDAMTVGKKTGAALVSAGLQQLKDDYNKGLVNFVAGTMNQIKTLQDSIDRTEIALQFQKDRLAAIHDGKFTISAQGRIYFNDGELNVGLY